MNFQQYRVSRKVFSKIVIRQSTFFFIKIGKKGIFCSPRLQIICHLVFIIIMRQTKFVAYGAQSSDR